MGVSLIRFYCVVRNLIRTGDDGYYHANHEEIKKKIWAAKDIIICSMGQQKNGCCSLGERFLSSGLLSRAGLNAINRSLN